jgi:putative membrane protein
VKPPFMFSQAEDSVSNIHKRWALTKLNPSTSKASFVITCCTFTALVVLTNAYVTGVGLDNYLILIYYVAVGNVALFALTYLDYVLLKGTSLSKLSKIFHVSAFSYLIWLLTLIIGLLFPNLISNDGDPAANSSYLLEGLLFVTAFRICMFKSVFGATIVRAILVGLVAPFTILFFFTPLQFIPEVYSNPLAIGYGLVIVGLGILWVFMADRAGRPEIRSTFEVLQAFLAAWTEKDGSKFERIAEEKADEKPVSTFMMKFSLDKTNGYSLVIPEVHPGPFLSVGGSNLPYVLYNAFSGRAMVLHGVSDHALNIPSKEVLERYLTSLKSARKLSSHSRCSRPVRVEDGHCSVTGIRFDGVCMLILSMSPKGMEDVPYSVLSQLNHYSKKVGFDSLLLIDSHNAMGVSLDAQQTDRLRKTAERCVDKLVAEVEYPFRAGYANIKNIHVGAAFQDDLGESGLAVLALCIDKKWNLLAWADSNNMKNGLREKLLKKLTSQEHLMVEICTSDTHSTSGKRTRNGYFALGELSKEDSIVEAFQALAHRAMESAESSSLELYSAISSIKVMGTKQLDDYSSALDRSMRLTKIFLCALAVTFVSMILLT